MFKPSLEKLIKFNIIFLFVLWLFFRPIEKYYENAYSFPRVNFSALALVVVGGIIILFVLKWLFAKKIAIGSKNFFSVMLLLLVLSIQIVSLPIILGYGVDSITALKYFSMTFIGYISFYLFGNYIEFIVSKKNIILTIWIVSTLVYLKSFLVSESFFIFLNGAKIYLVLSDAYAILSIFVSVLVEKKIFKYLVFFISAFILFTLVSRTSFFLFIFVSALYFISLNFKLSLVLFSLLFFGVVSNFNYIVNDLGEENRMIRLFTTGEDSSLSHREEIKEDNRKRVTFERVVLGEYLSDVMDFGHSGRYIHSYESFLYNFGILPYIWLYSIIFFILYKILINIKKVLDDKVLQLIGILGLFLTIEIMFSRAYVTPYIWIIIGALPIVLKRLKNKKRIKSVNKCINACVQ